jgi:hypothetical protein
VAFTEGGDSKSQDSEVPWMGVSDNVVKAKNIINRFYIKSLF